MSTIAVKFAKVVQILRSKRVVYTTINVESRRPYVQLSEENRIRSWWQSRHNLRDAPELVDLVELAKEVRATWGQPKTATKQEANPANVVPIRSQKKKRA